MIAWLAAASAGTVSGTISAADGAPVEGAVVVVYDQRLGYAATGTDEHGDYVLEELPPNPYRLRVLPPMDVNLTETWSPSGLGLCNGTPHPVGEDDELELSLVITPGAVLEGVLVDAGGVPVPGAEVYAKTTFSGSTVQAREAETDLDGYYRIQGLALEGGSYAETRVRYTATGWPEQWLGSAYREEDGEILQVFAEEPVDLGSVALLDGIRVQGAVSGPDGPITEGTAYVYSPNQVVSAPVVDGVFEASGLPPGDVLVWATAEEHAVTYYPDTDRPGERLSVEGEGAAVAGVELQLPYEATIRGQVIADGDLSGISLLAYNDTRTVGFGASVDEEGAFEIGRLHGGNYTVQVYAADEGYLDDLVRDDAGNPRVIELPDEGDLDLTLALQPGATVRGTVRDLYTQEPVYGAYVIATALSSEVETGQTVSYAVATAADGSYALTGIRPGVWEVRADYQAYCAVDPDWVRVFHPATVNSVLSVGIDLGSGDEVTWDALLPPDRDHDGMDDAWEAEVGLDPTRDDSQEDTDGDGFTNLDEYLLGTDPLKVVEDRFCGCGGGGSAWLLLAPAAWWRRRRRRGGVGQPHEL